MTQTVSDEISKRIAYLEPKVEDAWKGLKEREAEMEPFKLATERACHDWCMLNTELRTLKALVKPETETK